MKIVLLSNHYYRSLRKAGFHLVADALHAAGHEITFITTGLSWISYARRDYRTAYPEIRQSHGKLIEERPKFFSFVHFTPWHPHTLIVPFLNTLTSRFMNDYERFSLGEAEARIKDADIIIYESCNALFLVKKCRNLAPDAKHVYRVSDEVRILRSAHPRLFDLEMEVYPSFDLISVPCSYLAKKFARSAKVKIHPHGVDIRFFEQAEKSPYTKPQNCVFIGNAYLDTSFIINAANGCPEVNFHVIGPFRNVDSPRNVTYYGEMTFESTIPYVKFADVGLYCLNLAVSRHSLSFTDSLKLKQYRYCGLPVVAPKGIDLQRDGAFYYDPAIPESAAMAVKEALHCGKNPEWAREVQGWDAVAANILADL